MGICMQHLLLALPGRSPVCGFRALGTSCSYFICPGVFTVPPYRLEPREALHGCAMVLSAWDLMNIGRLLILDEFLARDGMLPDFDIGAANLGRPITVAVWRKRTCVLGILSLVLLDVSHVRG